MCDAVRATHPQISELEVTLNLLRNLGAVWQMIYPVKQQRIAHLLIQKVVVDAEAMSIVWHDVGWAELAAELRPGTIGAELKELEEAV